jgi:hypothetical protein
MYELCTLSADLSRIVPKQYWGQAAAFWQIEYDAVLIFNGAKLQGRIEWEENVRLANDHCSSCLMNYTGKDVSRTSDYYSSSALLELALILLRTLHIVVLRGRESRESLDNA